MPDDVQAFLNYIFNIDLSLQNSGLTLQNNGKLNILYN